MKNKNALPLEAQIFGLEGRGHYVHHNLPLNGRAIPGFPLVPGTLDLSLMAAFSSAWVRYHELGG